MVRSGWWEFLRVYRLVDKETCILYGSANARSIAYGMCDAEDELNEISGRAPNSGRHMDGGELIHRVRYANAL